MTLAVGLRAEATTIYTFDGTNDNPTTITANASSSLFDFSDVALCMVGIGNPGPSCGGFGDSTGSFTVTPLAGYTLSVMGFSFDESNFGAFGPTMFNVFTSADGFASAILSGTLGASAGSFTNHSTSLALSGLTGPFEVRIVAAGRGPVFPQSAWLLDNVTLVAQAVPQSTPVPEPATLLLLGTGLGTVAARRRLKRRA